MNPMVLVLLAAAGFGVYYLMQQQKGAVIPYVPSPSLPIGVAGGSYTTVGTYAMWNNYINTTGGGPTGNKSAQMAALAAITHFDEPLAWELLQWWFSYYVTGRTAYETEWIYKMKQIGSQHGWTEES